MLLPAGLAAKPEGLFYYVPAEEAWQSLQANARRVSIVAPQVFTVNREAKVTGTVEEKVRTFAARNGIRLMPLLVNENFSPEVAHAVLSDAALRRQVIAETVRLCRENDCWGLQLDFEHVEPNDGEDFTRFVQEAAQAFHQGKLRFSVAVPSPLFEGSLPQKEYKASFGGFVVGTSPYDFRELARHADFLSLMAYDHHAKDDSPGPVAGFPWVEQSVRFALRSVPRNKLFLGLGLYARNWCDRQVSETSYAEINRLAQASGAGFHWHAVHRSPWFETAEKGCHRVVWFENRKSLGEKLALVRRYKLAGFSAWRLGQEDSAFWRELPPAARPAAGKGPKSA